MQQPASMTDIPPAATGNPPRRSPSHGHSCRAQAPFARLVIGDGHYEVAHANSDLPLLAFRLHGQMEWTALDRQIADGWIAIAADILLLDADVIYDFLTTHAVRLTDTDCPEEMQFNTLGLHWSARLTDSRTGEVRFGSGTWRHANLGLRAPTDRRACAILLLLACFPDARERFEPHISYWARRIAQGVSIQPIL